MFYCYFYMFYLLHNFTSSPLIGQLLSHVPVTRPVHRQGMVMWLLTRNRYMMYFIDLSDISILKVIKLHAICNCRNWIKLISCKVLFLKLCAFKLLYSWPFGLGVLKYAGWYHHLGFDVQISWIDILLEMKITWSNT